MTDAIAGALWASIAGTVIALLLATIVAAFVRLQRPAASTRCTLWLIVLSTCVLAPAVILGVMSVPSARSDAHADGVRTTHASRSRGVREERIRPGANAFAPQTLLRRPTLPRKIADAVAVVWLGGALVGCIGLLRSVVRVRALKRRSSPLDGSLAEDLPWLTQRPGREIYLRLSYEIETPIAIGFRRPVILIPTEMATLGGLAAIEPLVMHEYAHLARYDDWTNLWQRVVERLAWWNPLVWFVGRRLALEREVAADDAVVNHTHDAAQYATTLWRLAREMRMPEHVVVAPGAMLTRKQISVRIERLLDDSVTSRPYVGAGLAVAALAACTVAAVAASAPRFSFTRYSANNANTATARSSSHRLHPRSMAYVARTIASPAPVRSIAMNLTTPASIAHIAQRSSKPEAIVRATSPALAMHVWQTPPSMRPVKPATPAPDDVRGETLGPFHSGCMGCDLQNADLHGQDFRRAHFQGANMQNADLHGANLRDAVLFGVNLENANLDGADLRGAQLNGTNLQGASMRHTLTAGMSLMGTSLP